MSVNLNLFQILKHTSTTLSARVQNDKAILEGVIFIYVNERL